MTADGDEEPAPAASSYVPADQHVILCGDDALLDRVTHALVEHYRVSVTLILPASDGGSPITTQTRSHTRVVESDVVDDEVLDRAGIQDVAAVAFVGHNEAVNFRAALTVGQLRQDIPIVLRVHSSSIAGSLRVILPNGTPVSEADITATALLGPVLGFETIRWRVADRPIGIRCGPPGLDAGRRLCPVEDVAGDAGEPDREPQDKPYLVEFPPPTETRAVDEHTEFVGSVPTGTSGGSVVRWLRSLASALSATDRRATIALAVNLVLFGAAEIATLVPDAASWELLPSARTVLHFLAALLLALVTFDVRMMWRLSDGLSPGDRLSHHVVITGPTAVGASFQRLTRALGIPSVNLTGDDRSESVLRAASIDTARALLLTEADDGANLTVAMTARAIKPDLPVVAGAAVESGTRLHREPFHVLGSAPFAHSAPFIAAGIFGVRVVAVFTISGTVLLIAGLLIEPGSQLHGTLLSSVDRDGEARILYAVTPDGVLNCRSQDHRARGGEVAYAVCTPAGLGRLALRARAR